MANNRIDLQGLPKGLVYEATTPVIHRNAIIAIDAADPIDDSSSVDSDGYEQIHADVNITGVDFVDLTVQAMFWDSVTSTFFGGGSRTFTTVGKHAIIIKSKGKKVFIKITAFNGTSFSCTIHTSLQ